MEVPATTKVKVTDFFQRLVCGALTLPLTLVLFHDGWSVHQVTGSGSGPVVLTPRERFLSLLNPTNQDESPGGFDSQSDVLSQSLRDVHPEQHTQQNV